MKELIFLVEEDPEGGYTAQAVGETTAELNTMICDAIDCHYDSQSQWPQSVRLHFVEGS